VRCWPALLLLLGSLAAGEGEPAVAPLPAVPRFTYSTSGGAEWSLTPDRPSKALGMRAQYDEIRIHIGRLTVRTSAYPGSRRPLLQVGELFSTPELPLEIDTSASKMPGVGFRGLLRPSRITFTRQDSDPAIALVRFRVELTQVGDVHGMIDTPRGPRQLVAQAETVVLDIAAPLDPVGALGRPRMTAMHLYGTQERPMRFLTIRDPVPSAEATTAQQWDGPHWGVRKSNDWLSLQFGPDGRLVGSQEGLRDHYEERDGEGVIMQPGPSTVPTIGK
jgi:hypothetical protein